MIVPTTILSLAALSAAESTGGSAQQPAAGFEKRDPKVALGTLVQFGKDDVLDEIAYSDRNYFWKNINDLGCFEQHEVTNPKDDEVEDYESNQAISEYLSLKVSANAKFAPAGSIKASNSFSSNSSTEKYMMTRSDYTSRWIGSYTLKTNEHCAKLPINTEIIKAYNILPADRPPFEGSTYPLTPNEREKLDAWRKFWLEYEKFFEKWGTHIVQGLVMGAEVELFKVVESDKKITKKEFTAALCGDVDLTAAGAPGVNVEACVEMKNSTEKNESNESLKLRGFRKGGDGKIGSNLIAEFKKKNKTPDDYKTIEELKQKFVDSADTNPGILNQTWKPIWEITKLTDGGPDSRIKKHMEDYYYNLYMNLDKRMNAEEGTQNSFEVKYCVENKNNFRENKPYESSRECICGRSTVCKKDQICIPYNCRDENDDMSCGHCEDNIPKATCGYGYFKKNQCQRGQGDCNDNFQCGKNQNGGNLKCGIDNCKTLRAHLGLPHSDYLNIDDCCYDPAQDYKRFGTKSYFMNLGTTCADKKKQAKCMDKHEETWKNLIGNKLTDDEKKKTCEHMKSKNFCKTEPFGYNLKKKMMMDCCPATCGFCENGEEGESLRQVSRHLHV